MAAQASPATSGSPPPSTAAISSATLVARVHQYAATGTVDAAGLEPVEVDALYHVLHKLHGTFLRQYDCDEVKCDKTRKCPKCGVFRVQVLPSPDAPEEVECEPAQEDVDMNA
ncbi:hypothetical protein ACHHYP_03766 [Achlya hypogyna]|uniref:Uncharacterized protein n=1 Tax=Achlya hypogyna TaxID=1202772 RepID=A0A1V9ZPR0_ACHHY|nr:hypothetical protein ACHHYP_03766 [Achlya hypogyna]